VSVLFGSEADSLFDKIANPAAAADIFPKTRRVTFPVVSISIVPILVSSYVAFSETRIFSFAANSIQKFGAMAFGLSPLQPRWYI